jgi:putative ABC transport system permease protein
MSKRERDLDDEIRHHLQMAAEDRGAEAARREFGNITLIKEITREMWGWSTFDKLAQDLRYALRTLARSPSLAIVAILSLALGIGANTAIFSLINALLLKSLPVSHPEELVQIVLSGGRQGPFNSLSNPIWEALRDRQDVFSGISAYGGSWFNLSNGGEARLAPGIYVNGDYFSTLGVRAAAGRLFTRDDDRRGCSGAAVISHDFWMRQYAEDPDVIHRAISLENYPIPIHLRQEDHWGIQQS